MKWSRALFLFKKSAVFKQQSEEWHIHWCKNLFSRFSRFCYDSATTSPTVAYQAISVVKSRCDGRDMPMVVQPLRELPTTRHLVFALTAKSTWSTFCGSDNNSFAAVTVRYANGLKAKSYSKIRRIWRTSFYIDECSTLWT
jgi:hypothetical protein